MLFRINIHYKLFLGLFLLCHHLHRYSIIIKVIIYLLIYIYIYILSSFVPATPLVGVLLSITFALVTPFFIFPLQVTNCQLL